MTRNQAEKMLKRMAETAELLAGAQASLVETNAILVDVLITALSSHAQQDDTPPTMQ
ncbi:MAG: hypothetical protein V4633_13435 [Pseudomonadota bacterium]